MDNSLAGFFQKGLKKHFSEGEVILDAQDASGVFFIASGFVKIYSISDEGNQYVHSIYKSGEIFPLIWALKGIRRRIFYEAISAVSVWEVPLPDFMAEIKNQAKISNELLKQLAEQFYIYADRLDNLQYKSAYEQVVYRLLFLAGRFGIKQDGEVIIDAPLTHELIAQSINLARESVSRQIEKLEKSGLVDQDHSRLVIKNLSKLAQEFSEPVSLDLWGLKE